MAGSHSRNKGARFERATVKAFQESLGGEWRRSRGGESQRIVGDVRPLEWDDPNGFPFVIECKVSKDTFLDLAIEGGGQLWDWWEQACEQTPQGKIPLLICKWDRHATYAVTNVAGCGRIGGPWQNTCLYINGEDGKLVLFRFQDFLEMFSDVEEERRLGLQEN